MLKRLMIGWLVAGLVWSVVECAQAQTPMRLQATGQNPSDTTTYEAPATGVTGPAGGGGLLRWLSGIYQQVTNIYTTLTGNQTSGVSGALITTGSLRVQLQGTLGTHSGTYSANQAIGALTTLAGFAQVTSGTVEWATLIDNNGNKIQEDLFFFKANPTGTTCTDGVAFSVAAADLSKIIGVVHVGDFSQNGGGTAQILQSLSYNLPFKLPAVSGTTAWMCAVTRGAPVYIDTAGVTYYLDLQQDLN